MTDVPVPDLTPGIGVTTVHVTADEWAAYRAWVKDQATVKPSPWKKAWRGFLAGITSTDAVKLEKSLLVLVVTRVLVTAGAGAGIADLVTRLLG